jgi:transcriptional regulator with XRE-family HTH domain
MFLEIAGNLCGGQMPQPREVQESAAYLRMLKDRAGRTYAALAKRTGVSSSALHRYCNGTSIPLEFAPLDRLARACGASREELRELQRRWLLADAARKQSARSASAHPARARHEPPERPASGAPSAEDQSGARPPGRAARPSWLTIGLVAEFLVVAAAAVAFGTALANATAGEVKLRSSPSAEVEQRIRDVFPEDPDKAVAIARCQSHLDPFWVAAAENGARSWGLFQIWDRQLEQLGGTPLKAFDPEWNIQAARRLWSEHRDFRYWAACLAALESPTRSPPAPHLAEPAKSYRGATGPIERARQRPQPAPRTPRS